MSLWGDSNQDKNLSTDDKYFALSMLSGSKTAALAYLAATLESATPEIRHLYSSFCTQITQGHEALTALCVQKNWYHAYGQPVDQLNQAITDSGNVISPNA